MSGENVGALNRSQIKIGPIEHVGRFVHVETIRRRQLLDNKVLAIDAIQTNRFDLERTFIACKKVEEIRGEFESARTFANKEETTVAPVD